MYIDRHETHLAAQEAQARPYARLSRPIIEHQWQAHAPAPSSKGSCCPFGLTMPARYRLSHADLASLRFKAGKRLHGALFSLLVAPLPDGSGPKMACVVSKKVSLRAIDRNAVDRRLREALRPLMAGLDASAAYVFYAKSAARGAPFADVKREAMSLLERAR